MAEFRALGRVEFTDLDPVRGEALLAQPKRVVLLSYLILGDGGPGCSRGNLVHLFWPAASRERGQGSLRSALHYLRQQLGRDTIQSRGERVYVDPDALLCDAVAFDALIAANRPHQALELYRGDFLPGLTIPDSPTLAGWLDAQRARLRRAASSAAWTLSEHEERRHHWISAVDLGRRATELDSDQEQSVRRLLRLLHRAGDRVAALRQYESFRRRWEREFALEPSPQTVALVDAIRAGPEGGEAVERGESSGGRSGQTRRIAVLPFELSGDAAGLEYLGTALAHEVIDSLNRLSEIRVIARSSVDRYRVREGRTVRQIADELGTHVVLDGSLRVLSDRLMVVARLIDTHTNDPIWGQVYEMLPREALSVGVRLVLDVLNALRIRPPPDQVEHLAATAADADAYALYLEGRSLWNRRSKVDAESAARLFERALEIDPGFARAWAGLADVYLLLHPVAGVRASEARARAREAARTALRIDPRLGEAHATLGLLSAALEQDWNAAEEKLRQAVRLSPGLATAHHWLGGFLVWIRQRFAKGCYELALALQLDPHSPIIHTDMGLALFHSGRRQEALLEFRAALELEPDFWKGHYDLGMAACICGDPAEGVFHLEQAWASGAWGANVSSDAPRKGSSRPWRDTLEAKLNELAARPPHRGGRAFESAAIAMLLGRHEEAMEWLRVVASEGSWAFVMQYYPVFEALHERSEFKNLLEDAGLSLPGRS